MSTVVDYHKYTVNNALRDVEHIITNVRTNHQSVEYEFITGFGNIRTQLMKLLQQYSLNPTYKLGNAGTIVCVIE